jgi:hypothetical protein
MPGKTAVSTLFIVLALAASEAAAQDPATEAVSGILAQFNQYRVVMLGEMHESIQEHAFLNKLVSTPDFPAHVNDVVVEVCNSLYQEVMDRYIAGEDVPLDQLRPSWENVVGAPGGVAVAPYHGLFATIRSLNQKLPKARRLRVLCGDPPIDWSRVETRDDIAPFLPFRDEHYAGVVRYSVLALRRKALLIMGSGHFQRREGKPGAIEQQMIQAFARPYVILPGSNIVGTYDDLDVRFDQQPAPWLLAIKGSWLGDLPRWQELPLIGYPATAPLKTKTGTWEQTADAYLYLGPRDKLTQGSEAFDLEGTPFGAELRRRWKIIFPNPPAALPKSDGKEHPLFQRTTPPPPALPHAPR